MASCDDHWCPADLATQQVAFWHSVFASEQNRRNMKLRCKAAQVQDNKK
jgi:hypothetical protein